MIKLAKLFTTGGSQAIRLPKEFRFPGKAVVLRRTAKGLIVTPHDDLEERRLRFQQLAGSCHGLPEVPRHSTPDLPRDLSP
jgi:virulence-associated protein VagC